MLIISARPMPRFNSTIAGSIRFLGACNPQLAHVALTAKPEIGLMLPCNVTLEENELGTLVNLVNPETMLLSNPMLADTPGLKDVALDATARFKRIADSLNR